jgi:arylsulfatase A-like enzyme
MDYQNQANILVILVDQLRTPHWSPSQEILDQYLPAQAALRRGAVVFANYYTAATACTPSRSTLLTGLYTHQNGMLATRAQSEPAMHTGFPTWGKALREIGYQTNWYGKWHLSDTSTLEPYGFAGGTFPSPNGEPQEGILRDPGIVDQFLAWFDSEADRGPWVTTVSLINPHDIMYYPAETTEFLQGQAVPQLFRHLPPNFETPETLRANHKPHLTQVYLKFCDVFGPLPYSGDGYEAEWIEMQNAYLFFQQEVDRQIARVTAALDSKPAIAERTLVIFLSDHGEYLGSHGLRGKAGGLYEEGIHVPLAIKDPTGWWARSPEIERTQLVSSVDFFGLLLTLATGDNAWRSQAQYAHLADRADLGAILRDPHSRGRPYILSTADEPWTDEYTLPEYPDTIPNHAIAYRTRTAKLGFYSHWEPVATALSREQQEWELYDYAPVNGRRELLNEYATKPQLAARLRQALETVALPNELRKPLPLTLKVVQEEALQNHFINLDNPKLKWSTGNTTLSGASVEGVNTKSA